MWIRSLQTKRREITYSVDAEAVVDVGLAIARTLLLVPIVLPELLHHEAR